VTTDNARDVLRGDMGQDWFFGALTGVHRGIFADRAANELISVVN
jgi:hypothetical protein